MITLLEPVVPDEVSYKVAALHQALRALGLPVAAKEVRPGRAGEDTRARVRALQKRLGLPIDEKTLLDEATALAVEGALEARGLTAPSNTVVVTGTVQLPDGAVKRQQRLLAFDVGLRGVAAYHTVESEAEIRKNGGFTYLGQTVSDNRGRFRLKFYDWQCRRVGTKADVVLYAVEPGQKGSIIVGRSRLFHYGESADTGLIRGLDIAIAGVDRVIEYEWVKTALVAFLRENRASLAAVSQSPEQLAFTAAELEVAQGVVEVAAAAERLSGAAEEPLSEELLYGLGRQGIRLVWSALCRQSEEEMRRALARSVNAHIIQDSPEEEVSAFLLALRERSIVEMLGEEGGGNPMRAMLDIALPEEAHRRSFLQALATFHGDDPRKFWTAHLPAQQAFRNQPHLVASLLLTQQLALLTGNHQPLMAELHSQKGLSSIDRLLDMEEGEWLTLVKATGVPDSVPGENDEEKASSYVQAMRHMLDGAFPTSRVARMVEKNELPIERNSVSRGIIAFLRTNPMFDFAVSRIHDFKHEITAAAHEDADEVRRELKRIQRAFQVSTSPAALRVLLEKNLHSAYTIANIPRRGFVRTYGGALGGEHAALAIHERASHISTRAEMAAMHIMEYSHALRPRVVMGDVEYDAALETVKKHLPNPSPTYAQLFGAPDLCECRHCSSAYSASAYMVDLLRFLSHGEANSKHKTPLQMLKQRRPDLLHLPLTCENTNTVVPYIDLANEVMEFYAANDSLTAFKGYRTGEATTAELRANPQHFSLDAYHKLADAKYPFTLPYHQPLDAIRVYSDHLKVTRYEAMKAANPVPDPATACAIAAEALRLSEEEYKVLTGVGFDGTADATPIVDYYGTPQGGLEDLRSVPEFLHRSGIAYTDLVELLQTVFVNPYQGALEFLQQLASHTSIGTQAFYTWLVQVEAGVPHPANDADVRAALNSYNSAHGANITAAELSQWVTTHLAEVRQVITLYQPESKCELATTWLRTLDSVFTNSRYSGISRDTWSRIHRFIRLWRKLGWTIHETDVVLAALGEADITAASIAKLEALLQLHAATNLPLDQLAVFWGGIDTVGKNSLYRRLFLNGAVQQNGEAFTADAWGRVPGGHADTLAGHRSALLAAFQMREGDLTAVLRVAKVIDGGRPRAIHLTTDTLNLGNLTTIYRYAVLARALKVPISDLCKLIELFGDAPFSTWDVQQQRFTGIAPIDSLSFWRLAESVRKTGFKTEVLDYVFTGTLPPDPKLGLDPAEARQTAKAIRDSFAAIDVEHPEPPPSPLTMETLSARLALTYQPEVVARFLSILDGTASFQIETDKNLTVAIPQALSGKYSYVKGSGLLTFEGVMSDDELATLTALNASPNYKSAVTALYAAPESFIRDNFGGILADLPEANATLLDHPGQAQAATLEQRLIYVYERFIPALKVKLRREAVAQHVSALIGLGETATALLITPDVETLVANPPTNGFSATYFADATWTNPVLTRTDLTIDFSWGAAAPDPAIPANNFSARWGAYLVVPASGTYTLRVDVADSDAAFTLYLDGQPILNKPAAAASLSLDIEVPLNAAHMHLLQLEYAASQHNTGVRLQWFTTITAPQVLPPDAAYPADAVDAFTALASRYHRAAKFVSGFALGELEIDHLVAYGADFNLDFKALTAENWRSIADYINLRNAVPEAGAHLTDVFAAASESDAAAAPTSDDLHRLHQATAWDAADLGFLLGHFRLVLGDLTTATALNRLREVIAIVTQTGLSAATVAAWGKAETDFQQLHATAQLLKNTVKSMSAQKHWFSLAARLSDTLRQNQQQALIGYLLTRPAIREWGAQDADDLFEYFLIDVQMGACMDTSRIVQANAAIQMFVNRCLLNLESDTSSGSEDGVSPDMIDKDRWEWMKNYRVWEANRKVFLYPENWLEPEWRNDRSEFFKELESYLVQNDITPRSVERAFRSYLTRLNEISHLDVCGMFQENSDSGELRYLHVFACTSSAPHQFYYRRWDKYGKWSAWESVPIDVRYVEDQQNSGVHLIPVVWKKRLLLFWPEFSPVQESASLDTNTTVEHVGTTQKIGELKTPEHWQIRLAWSERVEGKWSPKMLAEDTIQTSSQDSISSYTFIVDVSQVPGVDYGLTIHLQNNEGSQAGWFTMKSLEDKIEAERFYPWSGKPTRGHRFMKIGGSGHGDGLHDANLRIDDISYLDSWRKYELLYSSDVASQRPLVDRHFFYHDLTGQRTYFVRSVDTHVLDLIKDPDTAMPSPGLPQSGSPVDSPTSTSGAQVTTPNSLTLASTVQAFAGIVAVKAGLPGLLFHTIGKGLEFHTFYHPFSDRYLENLNRYGLSRGSKPLPAGLMESDTDTPSDDGVTFEDDYFPNFDSGFVQKPVDWDERTYYKENVCFDSRGANSIYNWELFFHAPLYIATRLSKNGRYEEAMKWFHYIFDPTSDDTSAAQKTSVSHYWKVPPFKAVPAEGLESWFRSLSPNADPDKENAIIAEWRDHPFDAHLIASNRPLASMKSVVLHYVDNLIAWGDSLFRQFSRESVNEALQIYVIANHILGPRPEFVPKRGGVKAESYTSLGSTWDDFGNGLVELENIFPYSSKAIASPTSTGSSLLGLGSALYFCIPPNDRMLKSWDTVADRLDKIRHCKDIQGVERRLALFAPPIEPSLLIRAASQGLSLGSVLADLSSPPPIYRFAHLVRSANEFVSDVKALGAALLAVLEKRDVEELGRLRATHETQMLDLITAVRERQVLDAKAHKENLGKVREASAFRFQHYLDLLDVQSAKVPTAPALSAALRADGQLPADTNIEPIEADVDQSLVSSDERGVKLIPKEKEDLDKAEHAIWGQAIATGMEGLAGAAHAIPTVSVDGKPFGIGGTLSFGGPNLGSAISALAKVPQIFAQIDGYKGAKAAKMAGFIRREQEWAHMANTAAKEIIQLDKQITSADIRIQIAEKELENHKQQIDHAKQVEAFLTDKFTTQELYQWMKEQLLAVHRQSYNLAFDLAKKAETAYRLELGISSADFIQYGYWDNSRQGLTAGEKLQLALRQMEKAYLEESRRELELNKSISVANLDPLALIELRETGRCRLSVPEELFDLDFRGHYYRRIKSVRVSIPCVAGPYTSVSCTLRLLDSTVRTDTSPGSQYGHNNDDGVWIEDDRFRTSYTPVTSIATSSAQNDSGTFDFSFRDERYLPFEFAGAISEWQIELSTEKDLRTLDYSTITDVILHISYTARESGGSFKDAATGHVKAYLANVPPVAVAEQPLKRMLSLRQELPSEWHQFLHPGAAGAEQILRFTLGRERFPFFTHDRQVTVMRIDLLARCTEQTDYQMALSYVDLEGDLVDSGDLEVSQDALYGNLHRRTIENDDTSGLTLEKLDVEKPVSLKLKQKTAQDYTGIKTKPTEEVSDVFLVIHYKLKDKPAQ